MCGKGSGELEPKGPAVSVWGSGGPHSPSPGEGVQPHGVQQVHWLCLLTPSLSGRDCPAGGCHSLGFTSQPVSCPYPLEITHVAECEHIRLHTCTSSHLLSWSPSEATNSWVRLWGGRIRCCCAQACAPLPFVHPSDPS